MISQFAKKKLTFSPGESESLTLIGMAKDEITLLFLKVKSSLMLKYEKSEKISTLTFQCLK
jgi:hypothetical protein